MPSEELQLLIAGYVLGDLDPAEAVEFERLLAADPTIAAELAQMQAALEQSYAPPEISPPPHLRSAILEAIDSQADTQISSRIGSQSSSQAAPRPVQHPIPAPLPVTPLPANPVPATQPTRRPFLWSRAWGAAAAVLIAALGFSNYRLWQELQATRTEIQPATALTYRLEGTESGNAASAALVVDPGTLEAALTVSNLPPPPPGKTYVLWTVLTPDAPFTVDGKNAVLTEVLDDLDAQGSLDETIAVPDFYRSNQYVAKVAVTLEDAAAPQAHIGTPVLITGL